MKHLSILLAVFICIFSSSELISQSDLTRSATSQEMAFEKSIKSKLFDLLTKAVNFPDYELVPDELNTTPNTAANMDAANHPYLCDMKIIWNLIQNSPTAEKMQQLQMKEANELMNYSGNLPKNKCLLRSGEYQNISISVFGNWKENNRGFSVLNNFVRVDSSRLTYFLKSDNCIPGGSSGTNSCSNEIHLFFGTVSEIKKDFVYMDGNREIGTYLNIVAKFNRQIPYLKLQSLFIIITAPKEFADQIYSKLDINAIKKMIAI